MQTSIVTFNRTLEQSQSWLKELQAIGNFDNTEQAYTALRGVLQSLRDRLILGAAAHLAAQMPLLIKGVYYDNWDPDKLPEDYRTEEEFLNKVRERFRNASSTIDAKSATRAVFKLLERKISEGEIDHIKSELPKSILSLWQ